MARTTFARLRPDVHLLDKPECLAEDLAMTGPRDVLLLFALDPRRRLVSTLTGYARTTRMNVITLTDQQHRAVAQRYSRLVIGCHSATYTRIPSHTALLSMLRLLAVAFVGHVGAAALERQAVIEQINEELDILD